MVHIVLHTHRGGVAAVVEEGIGGYSGLACRNVQYSRHRVVLLQPASCLVERGHAVVVDVVRRLKTVGKDVRVVGHQHYRVLQWHCGHDDGYGVDACKE